MNQIDKWKLGGVTPMKAALAIIKMGNLEVIVEGTVQRILLDRWE